MFDNLGKTIRFCPLLWKRMNNMVDYQYERQAAEQGYQAVCGVDEAGRGPLAGPVYAAAVILPDGLEIPGLNDSKKLTEKKREALFDEICEKAVAYGIGCASEQEIDEINILQATYLAMKRAVEALPVPAAYALIDGNRMPPLDIPGETVVKGDAKSASIAAASILAKTYRDDCMRKAAELYPQYGWERNFGYPTAEHRSAVTQYGITPLHRRSFQILPDPTLF